MGSRRPLALIQARDQGKARTMVEKSLGMTAVPRERAARLEQKEKGSWKEHSIEQKEHDRFMMHLSILTGVL